jgi:D-glycerate 3-kinase
MTNDKSQLLRSFYPTFEHFCQTTLQQPPQMLEATLWDLWLPLAMQIVSYRQAQSTTLIQGILGGQGTGKTTLAKILSLILGHLGYRTVSLSLDDLYKTYSDRLALQQQDPRLIWRGPPGTHDIQLGLEILDRLRQPNANSPIAIPRFDKFAWQGAGDRGTPEIVNGADIVLFEGWFVGVRPIDPASFDHPPPPINTCADRQFARDMNTRLQEYLPLWDKLDRLIVLYPVDYRLSQQWRKDGEHQAIAHGKTGMTDEQIEQFVEYFWKSLHPDLFIKPLLQDSRRVDLVIEINRDRSIGKVFRPSNSN